MDYESRATCQQWTTNGMLNLGKCLKLVGSTILAITWFSPLPELCIRYSTEPKGI